MPWYVAYTKPNNEKKVAHLLDELQVNVYCPLHETTRQWSDRKKTIKEPLFRSYIFVYLNNYQEEKNVILSLPGVVRFLTWLGKPGIVLEEEITAIENFLKTYKGANLRVDLAPGDKINITEGPLMGHNGELISIRGNKAILLLKSLRMQLTAEVQLNTLAIAK